MTDKRQVARDLFEHVARIERNQRGDVVEILLHARDVPLQDFVHRQASILALESCELVAMRGQYLAGATQYLLAFGNWKARPRAIVESIACGCHRSVDVIGAGLEQHAIL